MSRKLILAGVGTVVALGIGYSSLEVVDNGFVGVVYDTGGVQDETLAQGVHFTQPFDRVIEYPVKTRNKFYESLKVSTSDGKNLDLGLSIQYYVNPEKVVDVYKKYGNVDIEELEDGAIKNRVYDSIREVISKYTVIETFGDKVSNIKKDALEVAKKELDSYGFVLEDVVIGTPNVDEATSKAIDDRVKATQELERSKTDLQIAEANAKKKVVEAEAEAKANKILAESLTDEVVKAKLIEKWNGQQPITVGGNAIVDLKK